MKHTAHLSLSALFTAALAIALPAQSNASEAWDYAHGTERWGLVDSAYASCSYGLEQSPIDVNRHEASQHALPPIDMQYQPSVALNVANNGHTLQGVPATGGNILNIRGKVYTLLQFHIHAASETFLDGEQYPLELHFVHRAADGSLAVVGLLFDEGAADPELQKLIDAAPQAEGGSGHIPAFALGRYVPTGTVYRFAGSLTTPPCSEGVAWHISSTVRTASLAQLAEFASRYSGNEFPGGNRRPVQALNGRRIDISHVK